MPFLLLSTPCMLRPSPFPRTTTKSTGNGHGLSKCAQGSYYTCGCAAAPPPPDVQTRLGQARSMTRNLPLLAWRGWFTPVQVLDKQIVFYLNITRDHLVSPDPHSVSLRTSGTPWYHRILFTRSSNPQRAITSRLVSYRHLPPIMLTLWCFTVHRRRPPP